MTVEERIRNRKIGIIGIARSGISAALLAEKHGGIPFLSDSASKEELGPNLELLESSGFMFETGGHTDKLLESDYIILSPGVPTSIEIILKAKEKAVPLFSEIEFASWFCRGKIVAVTGSNGKTTTTSLIGELLTAGGYDAFVSGNIGLPFSEISDKIPQNGIAVVEISTFQLETIEDFKPDVALILNLSPDHLDRHGTFEKYKQLKYRIAENQTADNLLILNKDDKEIDHNQIETTAEKQFFSLNSTDATVYASESGLYYSNSGTANKIIETKEIQIPGKHNLENVAAAVCAVKRFNVADAKIAEVLKSFPGVEHRLEKMGKVAGISFVNDSKATNISSVICALRAIETPIYLIAGGRDKGADFKLLIGEGKNKIRTVVAIGEAKDKLFQELGRDFSVLVAETMEEAVELLFEQAIPGETVLLSPGCASFDMYKNYEERGKVFKEAVKKLRNGKSENEAVSR